MAEKNDTPPKAATNSSSFGNPRVIVSIAMVVVGLLIFVLLITQQLGGDSTSRENDELRELKQEVEKRKARAEILHYAEVGAPIQSPDSLVEQIKSDTEALGRLVTASASHAAVLRSTQTSLETVSRRNQDLEREVSELRLLKNQLSALENELATARQLNTSSVSTAEANRLRDQLASAEAERDRLQTAQTNMVDTNRHALVLAERDQLLTTVSALRAENQKLIAQLSGAQLFVSSEDLSPRAVALYRQLKKLESSSGPSRSDSYKTLAQDLGASVSEKITFQTGKAEIAPKFEDEIRKLTQTAPANCFFLVVGYASLTGDSQNNEALSSRRATRVASMVNFLKKEGQEVQAVYLGEGKRFGPEDAPNQSCEIWQIRPALGN